MAPDLDGKRLELLKEAFPKVARVAFPLATGSCRGKAGPHRDGGCGKALGVKLLSLEVRSLDDFDSAFARAKAKAGAHYIPRPLITNQQHQVLDFMTKNRLPAMYTDGSGLRPAA